MHACFRLCLHVASHPSIVWPKSLFSMVATFQTEGSKRTNPSVQVLIKSPSIALADNVPLAKASHVIKARLNFSGNTKGVNTGSMIYWGSPPIMFSNFNIFSLVHYAQFTLCSLTQTSLPCLSLCFIFSLPESLISSLQTAVSFIFLWYWLKYQPCPCPPPLSPPTVLSHYLVPFFLAI